MTTVNIIKPKDADHIVLLVGPIEVGTRGTAFGIHPGFNLDEAVDELVENLDTPHIGLSLLLHGGAFKGITAGYDVLRSLEVDTPNLDRVLQLLNDTE